MAYYQLSDSYYDYGDYPSDSRRTSNSFSEEINGAKRKKTNWGRGRGGGRGGRRQSGRGSGSRRLSPKDITIDTPLYRPTEPKRSPPPPPRRNPPTPTEGRKRVRERNNSFRPSPLPYFDMRDMPEFVEPEHSTASWQWENYVRGCRNWQDKHKLAYYQSRCTALEFENQMLFDQINQLIKENIVFAAERGLTPTMEAPPIPGFGSPGVQDPSSKNQGKSCLPSTDSEIEFNLTEDAVEYLETNIRHKLTLKKEKLQKKKKDVGSSASGAIANKNDGVAPKTPALKRKDELEQLYGKDSNLIHGLETSLQLNFNRNCDTFKPELYPATPINQETVV